MIINLNSNSSKVENYIKGRLDRILDFTGALQDTEDSSKILHARAIDSEHKSERQSIEEYVKTIGELGATPKLRKTELYRFPIWWDSPLAIKHDSRHWGSVIFFLKQFVKDYPEYFEKEVSVLLPDNLGGLSRFVHKNIFEDSNKVKIVELSNRTNQETLPLKTIFKYWLFRIKSLFGKKRKIKTNSIFFTSEFNAVKENNYAFDVSWYKKELEKKQEEKSTNLPFPCFEYINKAVSNSFYTEFDNYSPSVLQLLKKWKSSVKKINLELQKIEDVTINGIEFNKELLINEMRFFSDKPDNHLSCLWLNNFSTKNTGLKLYYSDEFFKAGRIINFYFQHQETVGIQHGIIARNHTIYRFINKDFEGHNALPAPRKFLVWNKSFGKLLTETCSGIQNNLEYTNDLHYSTLIHDVESLKLKKSKEERLKVLWTTTLWKHVVPEFNMIKSMFNKKNIEVTIRLHPVKSYVNRKDLENLLAGLKYTVSNNTYSEDLANCDLIITNSFSTVFYDAYKIGLRTFRIEHYGTFCDFDNQNADLIRDIKTAEEFKAELRNLL